jgi:RNA-directed DNA polymerase
MVGEKSIPVRWGTEAQGTHCREGETGHNILLKGKMGDTSRSQTVSTKLQRIAEQAKSYPESVFTTLAHLIDLDMLREAYRRTRKNAAPGVDGVTATEYAENLEENLKELHARLQEKRYKAPPVARTWIDKEDGKKRPIGKPTFEDKIVQRAVAMILGAIYEQDFVEFSYGFREGRSPHHALETIWKQCMNMNISWIVDADVSGFFDSIDHELLRNTIRKRVNDGEVIRLIGKWLTAGVLEEGVLSHSDEGTPQGGVISPMLANIFLHEVLDDWYVKEVKPRLIGKSFLVRFADDFIIGCEREVDARRIMTVLPKRFNRFKLTIHPKKSKLIKFRKTPKGMGDGSGDDTFDFLGFTHYWARSRKGNWAIKRKTVGKRLRRSVKAIWQWCRANRHLPIKEQQRKLNQKLTGHYQYYGIRHNYRMLDMVYRKTIIAWRYWLSRRSTKSNIPWTKFEVLRAAYPLAKPRIVHSI